MPRCLSPQNLLKLYQNLKKYWKTDGSNWHPSPQNCSVTLLLLLAASSDKKCLCNIFEEKLPVLVLFQIIQIMVVFFNSTDTIIPIDTSSLAPFPPSKFYCRKINSGKTGFMTSKPWNVCVLKQMTRRWEGLGLPMVCFYPKQNFWEAIPSSIVESSSIFLFITFLTHSTLPLYYA